MPQGRRSGCQANGLIEPTAVGHPYDFTSDLPMVDSADTAEAITMDWRAEIVDAELQALHASAFETSPRGDAWVDRLRRLSLGWVTAREGGRLVGFVNVVWDDAAHAFLLDAVVAPELQHRGVGRRLVDLAVEHARQAGCQWMHVDSEESAWALYESCGFQPTRAGLIELSRALAADTPR